MQTPPATIAVTPASGDRLARRAGAMRGVCLALAASLCLLAFALPELFPSWSKLSTVLLVRQDCWLLGCAFVVLAIVSLWSGDSARDLSKVPGWAIWAAAVGLVALCLAGHAWVLDGYDLSRDEQMAVFDAHVLSGGHLAQPLPEAWRLRAEALNLLFMLPVAHPVAWVSAYLPGNAALRAAVGHLVDPAATGPLLTGLGLLLLWACARRLWRAEREAAVVAALLYVGSGQILFAGMTAYAMPAHLTLDLLWLWLFLQARPAADAGALGVGVLATGLHQPLFHPLFALPFLLGLLYDRAWMRVLVYATGYAAICAVWLAWPLWLHGLVTGGGTEAAAVGTDYLSRLVSTVSAGNAARWPDMLANLLRFAAWSPVLLLPLMAAGAVIGRRERPTLALSASVVLPIVAMTIILPYQGHGFGYRYLHGVLGPAILLAVQGWRYLARSVGGLRPLLVRSTVAGLLVVLPLQAWMAHDFYAPYAQASARIDAGGADYAVVGGSDAPFSVDLVLNRPDLSNHPIRLLAEHVDDSLIAAICRPGVRVALPTSAFYAGIAAYFSTAPKPVADMRALRLSARLAAAGCTVERVE